MLTENGVVLICKKSVDGKEVLVYLNDTGQCRAAIIHHDELVGEYPILVNGKELPPFSRQEMVRLIMLWNFLEANSYITIRSGQIIFNPQGLGGGKFKLLCFLLGSAQVLGGLLLIASTAGVLSVAGSALVGSGVNGAIYSVQTREENIRAKDFLITSGVGAASGAIMGCGSGLANAVSARGAAVLATQATEAVASRVVTTVVYKGGALAIQAASGVLANTTARTITAAAAGTSMSEAVSESLQPSQLASAAAATLVSSACGAASSKVSAALVDRTENQFIAATAGALCGAASGSASAAATTAISNALGKKPIGEGVAVAAATGATLGATSGAIHAVNNVRTRQRLEDTKQALLAEREKLLRELEAKQQQEKPQQQPAQAAEEVSTTLLAVEQTTAEQTSTSNSEPAASPIPKSSEQTSPAASQSTPSAETRSVGNRVTALQLEVQDLQRQIDWLKAGNIFLYNETAYRTMDQFRAELATLSAWVYDSTKPLPDSLKGNWKIIATSEQMMQAHPGYAEAGSEYKSNYHAVCLQRNDGATVIVTAGTNIRTGEIMPQLDGWARTDTIKHCKWDALDIAYHKRLPGSFCRTGVAFHNFVQERHGVTVHALTGHSLATTANIAIGDVAYAETGKSPYILNVDPPSDLKAIFEGHCSPGFQQAAQIDTFLGSPNAVNGGGIFFVPKNYTDSHIGNVYRVSTGEGLFAPHSSEAIAAQANAMLTKVTAIDERRARSAPHQRPPARVIQRLERLGYNMSRFKVPSVEELKPVLSAAPTLTK